MNCRQMSVGSGTGRATQDVQHKTCNGICREITFATNPRHETTSEARGKNAALKKHHQASLTVSCGKRFVCKHGYFTGERLAVA
jgi:hypothetical protein